jgi:hypothetical protein
MGSSPRTYALEGLIVAIVGIFVASYLALAAGKHLWPFSNTSASTAGGVPTAYQATWNGRIGLPVFSVQLSLTLEPGTVNDVVGQISTSRGCVTAVILEKGGGPIALSLDASNSPVACQVLFSAFNYATVALVGGNMLKFSVYVGDRTVSCYLHHGDTA